MSENIKTHGNHNAVIAWLYTCCAFVFAMVVVGAITRLTESGLSMVEWRPLIGSIPPLNDTEWQRVFDLYRETPEYQKKNFWMGIDDFKTIFFWEWFHRVLGRTIGIVYALPLFWFAIRKQIPKGYGLPLCGMLLLGGAQGVMGWYMVQSGLVDQPAVSHYRLAAHLGLAFLIFSLLLWIALSLQNPFKTADNKNLYTHTWGVLGILIVTIFWGAYTAGLDAGLVYNEDFPKMGGQWIPPTLKQYDPLWINFFENPVGVQFIHRWLAIATVLAVLSLWLHAIKTQDKHWTIHTLAAMALIQMTFGIATLLSGIQITLAVLHQAGALTLLGLLVINLKRFKPVPHRAVK